MEQDSAIRALYYELRKDRLATHEPRKSTSMRDVIINGHHFFAASSEARAVRKACYRCTRRPPTHNKRRGTSEYTDEYVVLQYVCAKPRFRELCARLGLVPEQSSYSDNEDNNDYYYRPSDETVDSVNSSDESSG
jgi:hypothetical protein